MFFGMNNMVVATSQYWNQVHGNTPQEVAQDQEGLQTMRTLARNLAWILRCRQAAAIRLQSGSPGRPPTSSGKINRQKNREGLSQNEL